MDTTDLPTRLLDTLVRHLPTGAEWVPMVTAGILALAGLIIMAKGAKLAPPLCAIALGALLAFLGFNYAPLLHLPAWPAAGAGAGLGLIAGVLFFRVWFAVLLATCLVSGALTLYGGKVLRGPLSDYMSKGFDPQAQQVQLPAAGEVVAAQLPWDQQLAGLWQHLGESVPAFHASLAAIVVTTGLAGLVFALLLPKTSRAVWAASVGTLLFLPALYALLRAFWPEGAAALATWSPIVLAILWGGSLVYNLLDVRERRVKIVAAPAAEPAAA